LTSKREVSLRKGHEIVGEFNELRDLAMTATDVLQ
jgi:hypothetical protein